MHPEGESLPSPRSLPSHNLTPFSTHRHRALHVARGNRRRRGRAHPTVHRRGPRHRPRGQHHARAARAAHLQRAQRSPRRGDDRGREGLCPQGRRRRGQAQPSRRDGQASRTLLGPAAGVQPGRAARLGREAPRCGGPPAAAGEHPAPPGGHPPAPGRRRDAVQGPDGAGARAARARRGGEGPGGKVCARGEGGECEGRVGGRGPGRGQLWQAQGRGGSVEEERAVQVQGGSIPPLSLALLGTRCTDRALSLPRPRCPQVRNSWFGEF